MNVVNNENEREALRELLAQPNGNEAAFRYLIEHYRKRVYLHLRRMVKTHEEADDLVQETFMKAWRSLGGFRSESAPFTWLYRIATNCALSYLEKQKRNPMYHAVSVDHLHAHAPAELDGDAIVQTLRQAIDALPVKQRAVFCMRYFDELSYEDIHRITGTSMGALKASYHHAVRKIEFFCKQTND